jgi:maltose alpha-D-glucosyltransferase/alpha-amylase
MPSKKHSTDNKDAYWYKDAIIYELHVKAFCDSNGDGIGDFNGLLSKLDYLQNLGVTAIWLLPFYPSPLKDDGYDIADYYSIHPAYGNIRQFKTLLEEAHKRNLKVITELVINHTSDQHEWFQRARKSPKGSAEREFYVWTDDPHQYREVRIIFQDFETSNWTWDPLAQQYYWHRFFNHQPDLNYDNPILQKEIFKILDYWCNMGVDGFRLDAVPYLFEREGTNCENLPETHAFLKKLRKHVDEKYPGTLLLAEANMWPEDSAAYFGDGDECHMNYHFPVMPRMFMAVQMEDRYPITDIFDQTPAIPEACQWAMFLRNHDELTLEMVTDEERDYMYKVYTKDPKARINLGIRHRLAPLLDNNRKKIELLNYLLFSLPGTPVIYYGDEIGMGDNFYLGDRDGVRTPMQWSADRNAGFSTTDAYKLYLPVILDPSYHYESVNVDVQTKNTGSLLWWTKRVIAIRKKYNAFGRGSMSWLQSENPKILAFTRTHEDETILVIANLSRYTQPVELDLHQFEGFVPMEVFSKNKYPKVKTGTPYFFSLGPHDCQWLLLQHETNGHASAVNERPLLKLREWKELTNGRTREILENEIFPDYLLKMRWFGGKARHIQSIKAIEYAFMPLKEDAIIIMLLEVTYQEGLPDIYQLPLAFCKEHHGEKLLENHPKAVLSRITVGSTEGVLYDAVYGKAFQQELIKLMAGNQRLVLPTSTISFSGNSLLKNYRKNASQSRSKILSAEQSNTSVTYDDLFFLKLYRKVDRAVNPDLELTHFLTEKARFRHIPAFVGAIQWRFEMGTVVLGMMQELVQNSGDAWTYMLHQLDIYYERVISLNKKTPSPHEDDLISATAFEALTDDVKDVLDMTLVEQINLLGQRTGEMHLALASGSDLKEFVPEAFSLHYQRSLYAGFQSLVRSTFQNLKKNKNQIPGGMHKDAEDIQSREQDVLSVLKRIYYKKVDAMKIRIHGDFHLGQVLFTGKDFVMLDFEGEPARSYSERRLKRSPLRDVAGMIRSFHYAAYASLILNDKYTATDRERLQAFAEQWYRIMSGCYINAYLQTVKGSEFIPDDKNDLKMLLETYTLEKAIYELNYELNNRPDWTLIPIRGIQSVMQQQLERNENSNHPLNA